MSRKGIIAASSAFVLLWFVVACFLAREDIAYAARFYANEKQLRTEHANALDAYEKKKLKARTEENQRVESRKRYRELEMEALLDHRWRRRYDENFSLPSEAASASKSNRKLATLLEEMQTLEARFGRDELLHPKERKRAEEDLSIYFDDRPHLSEPRLGKLAIVAIGFPVAILFVVSVLFHVSRKARSALSQVETDASARLKLNLAQRLLAGSVGIGILIAQALVIADNGGINGYGWAISVSVASAFLLLSIHGLRRK